MLNSHAYISDTGKMRQRRLTAERLDYFPQKPRNMWNLHVHVSDAGKMR
jgi:hypothetical protein